MKTSNDDFLRRDVLTKKKDGMTAWHVSRQLVRATRFVTKGIRLARSGTLNAA